MSEDREKLMPLTMRAPQPSDMKGMVPMNPQSPNSHEGQNVMDEGPEHVPVEPASDEVLEHLRAAILGKRPVRSGLVLRLYRHAQFAESEVARLRGVIASMQHLPRPMQRQPVVEKIAATGIDIKPPGEGKARKRSELLDTKKTS